jgi:serine kinase of HPr protein (carbohydrate metabolism regulator)
VSSETLHAGCVAIGGKGVLILGRSGAGKSDLALRLIDRGAMLVSDDYTDLSVENGALIARPCPNIAGRIEMRGIGIVALPHLDRAPVSLILDLDAPSERLPQPWKRDVCGVAVPTIGLNGLEASAPIKVEAALLLHGLDPSCPP